MGIYILISGLKGLTGVNALSLKYEEITKPERFVNFHAAMKCICALLGLFTDQYDSFPYYFI